MAGSPLLDRVELSVRAGVCVFELNEEMIEI